MGAIFLQITTLWYTVIPASGTSLKPPWKKEGHQWAVHELASNVDTLGNGQRTALPPCRQNLAQTMGVGGACNSSLPCQVPQFPTPQRNLFWAWCLKTHTLPWQWKTDVSLGQQLPTAMGFPKVALQPAAKFLSFLINLGATWPILPARSSKLILLKSLWWVLMAASTIPGL